MNTADQISPDRLQGNEKIRRALEDILARAPKDVAIEVKQSGVARDEDDPWSGNIYKYSY